MTGSRTRHQVHRNTVERGESADKSWHVVHCLLELLSDVEREALRQETFGGDLAYWERQPPEALANLVRRIRLSERMFETTRLRREMWGDD